MDQRLAVIFDGRSDGAVKAAKDVDAHLDKTGKAASALSAKLSSVGGKLAGAFAVVAVGAFVKKISTAASDVSESMNKVQVVFGDAAGSVVSFSETAAEAMGMSQRTALEAAGTFGNLFVSMGLAGQQSADMSTSVVKLASDLASFNNVMPTDALEALRAGLVGETEPLRRFGININDAALRQEALKLGLVDTTTNVLPPAIRAQAAYSLILAQTKTAQGDFARTSDGLANSQRILNAQWEDTQAKLGEAVIPAMQNLVGAASAVLTAFNKLSPASRAAGLEIGVLGAAAVYVGWQVGGLTGAVIGLGIAWQATLQKSSVATGQWAAETLGYKGAADEFNASILGAIPALQGLADWQYGAGYSAKVLGIETAGAAAASAALNGETGTLTGATDALTGATDALKTATTGYTDALIYAKNNLTQVQTAEQKALQDKIAIKAATDAVTEAVKKYGKNSDEARLARLNLTEAENKGADSARVAAEQTAAAALAADRAAHGWDKLDAAIRRVASGLRLTGASLPPGFRLMQAQGSILPATSGGIPVTAAEDGVDEAFIPIRRDARSLALYQETGRRLGVEGGVGTSYTFNGDMVIPVSDLAQVASLADFFSMLKVRAQMAGV